MYVVLMFTCNYFAITWLYLSAAEVESLNESESLNVFVASLRAVAVLVWLKAFGA
jgi:hypothetical protein